MYEGVEYPEPEEEEKVLVPMSKVRSRSTRNLNEAALSRDAGTTRRKVPPPLGPLAAPHSP